MQVTFHEWEDAAGSRRAAASLDADEVQVWIATTRPHEEDVTGFSSLLSPDERQRAERMRVAEPRGQFVFGRALLRQLLGACLNVAPTALRFGYQTHGKPFLSQPSARGDFHFNLSHSGRLVAVALSRGREVGVDIESLYRLDDWLSLAGRIFSPRERQAIQALPASKQREAFFNGWTRKEAYLKATGEGLIDALPDIEVTLAPGQKPRLLGLPAGSEAALQWAIHAIPLPPDFAGAVAFVK